MPAGKDRRATADAALRRAPAVAESVPKGADVQPVSKVIWVDRNTIRPNAWNPNNVPGPELRLLKISIMADGWTQPIVVSALPVDPDHAFELVDGEHRWLVSADPEVAALTDGRVPVVVLRHVSESHRVMSTVRHNRARGEHQVMAMADIVIGLLDDGHDEQEVADLLQMEREEIERFVDRGNMVKRGTDGEWNRGWKPG